MKLKLNREELQILCRTILQGTDHVRYLTKFESQCGSIILQDLTNHLVERAFQSKEKYTIKLTRLHVITLNEVLTQMPTEGPFERVIISEIIDKIHKECLNT